jgi:hypothetical protein
VDFINDLLRQLLTCVRLMRDQRKVSETIVRHKLYIESGIVIIGLVLI